MTARYAPLVLLSAHAAVADTSSALSDLAKQLHFARSQPTGAKLNLSCPKNLEAMVGTSRGTLTVTLGRADYSDARSADEEYPGSEYWTYFLTAPRIQKPDEITDGGGFPEVSFVFDKHGRVVHVSCYLAR